VLCIHTLQHETVAQNNMRRNLNLGKEDEMFFDSEIIKEYVVLWTETET